MTDSPHDTPIAAPNAPDAPNSPVGIARADRVARNAWATLTAIGAVRPGMSPAQPIGAWWAVGGVPMEVVRSCLLDAMDLPEDAPFAPRPEETVRATVSRWMDESAGTPWEDSAKGHHTAL